MGTPIRSVSDTAIWVAMYRANESDRSDAIFRDPFARRLAGPRGEEILRTVKHMDWPMVVRTAVMDEIILRCVQQGCRTVLNLAAGLDARAYRLPLPPGLRWIDADLPDMVAYKQEHLRSERPVCRYEAVPIDLTDRTARQALFARAAADGPVLAVAEGLVVYLADDAVKGLAGDLHAAGVRWWLLDLASPALLKMLSQKLGAWLEQAPLRFAPAEGAAFFAPLGWREAEYRSTWYESLRLKRTLRMAWLWNLFARLSGSKKREQIRRFSGIVLLERT
jgi:methyltransferase (TIGR00027 family)